MKFFQFFVKDLAVKAIQEKRVFLITIFSLTITVFISFVLLKGMLIELGDASETGKNERTYAVSWNDKEKTEMSPYILQEVLESDVLPEVEEFSAPSAFLYQNQMNFLLITNDFRQRDTVQMMQSIIEGRWFTEEELQKGECVVVLDVLSGKKVGEYINLMGRKYLICGICENILESNYMPYKTALRYGFNAQKDITISSSYNFAFKSELTEEQKQELFQKATEDPAYCGIQIKSIYETLFMGKAVTYVLYLSLISLMILFCAINIASLFRYFSMENLYEYAIIKICGGKNAFLTGIMLAHVLVPVFLSYFLGLLLFTLTMPVQEAIGLNIQLPEYAPYVVLAGVFLITIFAYLPVICKVAKISPVDKRLWR